MNVGMSCVKHRKTVKNKIRKGGNIMLERNKMTEAEKLEWVYAQLEDNESRFIFQERKQFNENGDYRHIEEIIDRYVPELKDHKWNPSIAEDFLKRIKKTGRKVIIWGAGYNGRILLQMCNSGGGKGRIFL